MFIYIYIYICIEIYIYIYRFRLNLLILLAGSVVSAIVYIDNFVIYKTIYLYIDICICVYLYTYICIEIYIYIYSFRPNLLILLAGSVVSAIVYIDNFVIYTTTYMYIQIFLCEYIYMNIYTKV